MKAKLCVLTVSALVFVMLAVPALAASNDIPEETDLAYDSAFGQGLGSLSEEARNDQCTVPFGYSQVTYSAIVTNNWIGTKDAGVVHEWKNTIGERGPITFGSQYVVSNGYTTDMSGAKSAIQTAVGYNITARKVREWQYTSKVTPGKTIRITLTDKFKCQDLKTTKKYDIWVGNSLYPSSTVTNGTATAWQWYTYECKSTET